MQETNKKPKIIMVGVGGAGAIIVYRISKNNYNPDID